MKKLLFSFLLASFALCSALVAQKTINYKEVKGSNTHYIFEATFDGDDLIAVEQELANLFASKQDLITNYKFHTPSSSCFFMVPRDKATEEEIGLWFESLGYEITN